MQREIADLKSEAKDQFKNGVDRTQHDVKDAVMSTVSRVQKIMKDKGGPAIAKAGRVTREHPASVVFGSAILGLLVGAFLGRRSFSRR